MFTEMTSPGVNGIHGSSGRRRPLNTPDLFTARKKSSCSSDPEMDHHGLASRTPIGPATRLRKGSKGWDASSPKLGPSTIKRKTGEKACSTPECTLVPKNKRKIKSKPGTYCEKCTDEIDNGNYCHICLRPTASNVMPVDWVECETCKVWNHVKCEESQPDQAYADLSSRLKHESETLIYKCPDCRTSQAEPNQIEDDFTQQLENNRPPRKQVKRNHVALLDNNYLYPFSENYQPIDKILSNAGKQLPLTVEELNADLSLLKIVQTDASSPA